MIESTENLKGKADVISINEIPINLKEKLGTRTDSIYHKVDTNSDAFARNEL